MKIFNILICCIALPVLGFYCISANWQDILAKNGNIILLLAGIWYALGMLLTETLHLDILVFLVGVHLLIFKQRNLLTNWLLVFFHIVSLLVAININYKKFVKNYEQEYVQSSPPATRTYNIIDEPKTSLAGYVQYMGGMSAKAYAEWRAGRAYVKSSDERYHSIFLYKPMLIFKLYLSLALVGIQLIIALVRQQKQNALSASFGPPL